MASKLITMISNKTFDDQRFQNDYKLLIRSTLLNQGNLASAQIDKLLKTAGIFSLSENENYQKLSAKIALFLISKYRNDHPSIPFLAETILTRLGDLPTIRHIVDRKHGKDFFSFFNELALPLEYYLKFPEIGTRKFFNQILIGDKIAHFTNFQSRIFNGLKNGDNIAFSAPTSSGKSFLLQNFIIQKILEKHWYNAIYLVPTKSLMFEIQQNLVLHLHSLGIDSKNAMVVTSSNESTIFQLRNVRHKVLILTPERLQQLLVNKDSIQIDLLIVDEAQKVSDESRGVILEDAVQELIRQQESMQVVFISPNTKTPKKFKEVFALPSPLETDSVQRTPVGQNIFFVNFNPENVTLKLLIQEFNEEIEVKKLNEILKVNERHQYLLKAWTAIHFLKNEGHTLIYCNYPKECIKVADKMMEDLKPIENKKIDKAIDFLQTHVHPDYFLVNHLRYGIGYHYGDMPQFVRFIVKDLFDKKTINYLCCTSTLLEGVNLPANNMILHHPKSGHSKPMDKSSVLNLAGRAGRLGKEYYGNIYCVNISDWKLGQDAFDGKLEDVQSSVEVTMTLHAASLLEHLREYTVQPFGKKNIQSVATSLIVKRLKYSSSDFLIELKKRYPSISEETMHDMETELNRIAKHLYDLDKNIILKNSSIDPRLQHELFLYLKNINQLILPPYPTDKQFRDHLRIIFQIIANYLMKDYTKSYKFYTIMADFWIHQHSYKYILERRLSYEKNEMKKKTNNLEEIELTTKKINDIIDKLDDTLERQLKFEYARGLKCYCDIIEKILRDRGSDADFCRDLPDFLEAGAFQPKIFLLMSLGISRNASITISKLIPDDISTVIEALESLRKHAVLIKPKVHELVYEEIKNLTS